MMIMVFSGFFSLILSRDSRTDSFLEYSLKSTTLSLFIALEAEGVGSHFCGVLLNNWFVE